MGEEKEMLETVISKLPEAAEVNEEDTLMIIQNGTNKRIPVSLLKGAGDGDNVCTVEEAVEIAKDYLIFLLGNRTGYTYTTAEGETCFHVKEFTQGGNLNLELDVLKRNKQVIYNPQSAG